MDVQEFLSHGQRLLTEKDYIIVQRALDEGDAPADTGNAAADAWSRFIRNFRNELVWFRAQRAAKDPQHFIRGVKENEPQWREVILQASKMSHPMDAQKYLDRACWNVLDDLAQGHYFDLDYLIVYGLKLKILQRHQEYRSPRGRNLFDEIRMMEFPESCMLESGLAGGASRVR